MSDLLEDQRIHYIVKDYRRMFNTWHYLKGVLEEKDKALKEKDKEILLLRSRVNELKNKAPEAVISKNKLKGILNEVETITNSIKAKLSKGESQVDKISTNIEELRQLISV